MSSFARFLLVFGAIVLALVVLGGGPFSGLSALGTLMGCAFAAVGWVVGALASVVFGTLALAVSALAAIPLLIPLAILMAPIILVVAIVVLFARLLAG